MADPTSSGPLDWPVDVRRSAPMQRYSLLNSPTASNGLVSPSIFEPPRPPPEMSSSGKPGAPLLVVDAYLALLEERAGGRGRAGLLREHGRHGGHCCRGGAGLQEFASCFIDHGVSPRTLYTQLRTGEAETPSSFAIRRIVDLVLPH